MTTSAAVRSGGRAGSSLEEIDGLRAGALEVGRAFAPVESLRGRTQILALNAQIVAMKLGSEGMPFAIVAGAVKELGDALADLVGDIESARSGIVRGVATYTRDERDMRWMLASVRSDGMVGGAERSSSASLNMLVCLQRETGANWRARYAELEPGVLDRELVRAMVTLRSRMAIALTEVQRLAQSLDRATTTVRELADLHGHFIGINALMEAARVSDSESSLGALGQDLYQLTQDMGAVITRASVEAAVLVRLARRVLDQVDPRAAFDSPKGETR